ncbi:MAG: SOS response-associated peptidase [Burkholderiales bacterium]|nr:SOS response-associated peptidase [Burkholderiales bacterium]
MCYSAQIEANYKSYVKMFGADISLREFYRLYWLNAQGNRVKYPKAMEAPFAEPTTDAEREIKALIDEFHRAETMRLEPELFALRKRLADAERKLQEKPTKTAAESARIAKSKIEQTLRRLDDLTRTELKPRDSRIFPGYFFPVMVMETGKLVVKPMRYQCRPAGKPAFYDTKYPGTFNARRDNLEGFWKGQFGYTHGVIVASAFYENVARNKAEGRELAAGEKAENVILEFRPGGGQVMYLACLWSHWTGKGEEDLLSVAAITDEPPPEVAAAGHDRCVIPLKPENVAAWLNPDPKNLAASYAILDDRERPYYEHRLAA